ncbi:hypothetical protein JG688_00008663 [Phytophthora aleatoria]|uniref:Uncharacterized protein n=1 Tax=Phytophthora aleatoria TaxID=2496075 RepID=A0A8J5M4I1_9STRA|nr:hypothetical protein JG688_00008663 [Phytophthora aleatoria]
MATAAHTSIRGFDWTPPTTSRLCSATWVTGSTVCWRLLTTRTPQLICCSVGCRIARCYLLMGKKTTTRKKVTTMSLGSSRRLPVLTRAMTKMS